MSERHPAAAPDPTAEQLLTRAEASARLASFNIFMKPATLARVWCVGSDGPPCVHIRQKPFYPLDALDDWARRQRTPLRRSARDPAPGDRET